MNNEQEWRLHLLHEIKEIRKDLEILKSEMLTLKLKVAAFSAIIGSLGSFFWTKIF
jgi:hypothetical protein